jgi:hypothetical protein
MNPTAGKNPMADGVSAFWSSPSGVNITEEQVFDRRCLLRGVTEVRRRLSRISAGTTIFWLDGIAGEDQ